jgi:hypothetical protein
VAIKLAFTSFVRKNPSTDVLRLVAIRNAATLPKDIRRVLRDETGDTLGFIGFAKFSDIQL